MFLFCSYKAKVANKLNFEFPKSHQVMFEPQHSLTENLNQAKPGWHKPTIPATQEAEAGRLQTLDWPGQMIKNLASIFKK